ncbi:MAG TPA: hypothetical protein VFV47_09220 [Hyphomicrobiaceae bacterium]|nr:hypothetical protein [Hyphomicrobiaceae bacterium]
MLLQCPPAERRRAIIDIGSNSIRLVIYSAERRIPAAVINEKVSAKLGRTLQEDGRLPPKAIEAARRGLARFATIISAVGVESISVVATAAVRDATNGPEFLEMVRSLGLSPILLSGSEEAAASAQGVLCAFPGARGVVADLGGGSLELVEIGDGANGRGVTLPLGTLRLAKMREMRPAAALGGMRKQIAAKVPANLGHAKPLYIVGGSWRALAQFAMHEIGWPIRSPHGFILDPKRVPHLVSVISHTSPAALRKAGVGSSRVAGLADGAAVLAAVVRHIQPSRVVVSTFGLREGLAFADMPPSQRARDPFIGDLEDQLGDAARGSIYGPPQHQWAGQAFAGESPEERRTRLAASWLGLAVRQPERPLRRERALELALHERWIGVTASARAQIAAALLAFVGEREQPSVLSQLCSSAELALAVRWGCVMRFAEKLSAGSAGVLLSTSLHLRNSAIELALPPGSAIYGDAAEQSHEILAKAFAVEPVANFA